MLSIVFSLTSLAITARIDAVEAKNPAKKLHSAPLELPSDFDSRDKFKECAGIIGHVRDQANCGSCSAMAVIGVFNDRLCIITDGAFNKLLSPGYAVACCTSDEGCETPGCSGATSTEIWRFAKLFGIPTGGDYKPAGLMTKDDGCWPYEFPQCDHTYKGEGKYPACSKEPPQTPACQDRCRNAKYTTHLNEDLNFVASPGEIDVEPEIDEIKQEIFNNGPVVATFAFYEDLRDYTPGVYKHRYGKHEDYHAVKLIGWGKTATEEYWLAVNSWNEEWGESGLFKIAFGECEIEQHVNYGTPDIPDF